MGPGGPEVQVAARPCSGLTRPQGPENARWELFSFADVFAKARPQGPPEAEPWLSWACAP